MRAFLERSTAAVVLAQELHIADSDGIATATAWARARGWQAVIAPATPTVGRGRQAGVGIFVRAEPSLVGLGLNFVGPKSRFPIIGFGRDRNAFGRCAAPGRPG
jgi:hypothetical protein